MVEIGESVVRDRTSAAQTLGEIHLRAEGGRARKVVMRSYADGRWQEMPTWRFYRQVIRVGLYMRERLRIAPGDRIVLLSALRPERIIADWAAVVQGAVPVPLDPRLPAAALVSALGQLAPKAAFVAGGAERARLLEASHGGSLGADTIVTFDAPDSASNGSGALSNAAPPKAATGGTWSQVLDLGGTLDTAERAQKFRAQIRAVEPSAEALGYAQDETNGTSHWALLSHAEIVRRVASFRFCTPSREGDIAYVAASRLPLKALIALYAWVGDERTTLAIGTPGKELEEIVDLRPHLLLAPRELADRAAPGKAAGRRRWVEPALLARLPVPASVKRLVGTRGGRAVNEPRLRQIVALDFDHASAGVADVLSDAARSLL